VNHSIDGDAAEGPLQAGGMADITSHQADFFAAELLHPAQGFRAAVAEII